MNFFRKTKGVISVFLIMIMLPLLTSAVVLVDGARYHSAKMMAQEAGDLAAYSTIANYNTNLKDEFGLFAIADKNVTATFKRYLTETLGYSADEAETYSKKVQNFISSTVFGGGSYKNADFFNMYNFNVTNASVTPLYPLSDPAVLQNQIVEYTKYRGVETLLERFEILGKFDSVSTETKTALDTMEAVENLSAIEESYVTYVSGGAKDLKEKVEKYDAGISDLYDLMDKYYDCAEKEIAAFAVNDSSVSSKKQDRINAYNDVISKLDKLADSAAEIYDQATRLSTKAQTAIDKLEAFKSKYPDQTDACATADQDINIMKSMLEQKETKYSLWYLKQNISAQQASDLKSSLKNNMDTLVKAIQTTYTNYQSDTAGDGRYHFTLKNGSEWWGTAEDNTGESIESFYVSAGVVVEEYCGVVDRASERIGTVSLKSYKAGFRNKFEDDAIANSDSDETMSAKDAADQANKNKTDSSSSSGYKTISSSDAALLPSHGSAEQSSLNIPDVQEDSASDTLHKASSNSKNIMSSFLESTRNDILTYCYLLDNFKTRVTEKGINSNTEHSGVPDKNLANWRYANDIGELDMRYRPKKDLNTFFWTNEVEYVFGGARSERVNATIVYSWIYGTRFVNNFAAVYSAYCSGGKIKRQIDALAAAASAATLGRVPASVFKWIFITAWAAGETALDLALLIDDGYKIPLIKTKDNLFIQSLFDIFKAFSFEGRLNIMRNQNSSSNITDKINVSYEDYLIILLAFVGRETRLKRIGDLVQMNMRQRCDAGFTMSSAYTYLKADTTVNIKYMFGSVKQFASGYNGTGLTLKNTIYQGY